MDPSQPWHNPATSFAYSLGEPKGSRGGSGLTIYCDLLRNSEGIQVPCRESHATCKVLKKTHTFWTAIHTHGCGALPDTSPSQSHVHDHSNSELNRLQWQVNWDEQREASHRGCATKLTCQGQLLFDYDRQDRPYIHCEFYSEKGVRDHLVHYGPDSGEYDIEYLQALFNEDRKEIHDIESEARQHGFDPVAPCLTVMNHTSVRVTCPRGHCDVSGRPQLGSMVSIPCRSLFRIYQPLSDYQHGCPKILVVCSGVHAHPVPLPTKTPPYLQMCFLRAANPALSDLHVSLANRDHLRAYLRQAKKTAFPFDDFDDGDVPLRVVICMLPQNSQRLQTAQYIQSDIGFKRVAGFQEFELGALTYCRIFMTCQSAAAHQFIFRELERIVELDTGSRLKWRHLHATDLDDLTASGILQWTGDQHGGQAKGLGLHLQWVAQQTPDRFDLHEPDRLISKLDEYDHLRRVFRLCNVHVLRNIKTAHVEESVKNLMRSLVCMEHPDFAGTLEKIELHGGKLGTDWVQDKVRSRFALAGDGQKRLQFDLMKLNSITIFETTGIRPSYKSGLRIENISRGIKWKGEFFKFNSYKPCLNPRPRHSTAATRRQRLATTRYTVGESQMHDWRKPRLPLTPVRSVDRTRSFYSKAVHSSVSAIGTGTGRVGLLLPRELADQRRR
ncbi:hypothetical protein BU15DRAFT_90674 [Melanogaster broomeanus]|nr:hypothetical protein BU15DRAFT_90674 [Melanogaster broomeanus]